jgi:hypothetical protein
MKVWMYDDKFVGKDGVYELYNNALSVDILKKTNIVFTCVLSLNLLWEGERSLFTI